MESILNKYAQLLVNYCLEIKPGEQLLVRSTTLAQPLIREVYRETLKAGGSMELDMAFESQSKIFYEHANEDQLKRVSPFFDHAIKNFDAFLVIRAPFNLREDQNSNTDKIKIKSKAYSDINTIYFDRTSDRRLKRSLCQYPTSASAQAAGMSLEEYQDFVFNACHLYEDNPEERWLQVRAEQQSMVDYLNKSEIVQYKADEVDITFSVKGRTWINSDGQNNMPSGEVFSAPVEDSVNGVIKFSYPTVYRGQDVKGVKLWVKDGWIEKWEAEQGKELLDQVFEIEGARRFGEVAIGTNYQIQRATKNILFDEKIGGSIHMAIGQSYKQCGGKNKSTIHWDMITNMKDGGQIFADGKLIYENGRFTI